jgi:cytochrome b561
MPISFKNSVSQYGLGGRLLHWSSVALLVTLILTAAEFEDLDASPDKLRLIHQHASYGFIFLFLMSLRLFWRCTNYNPVYSYNIQSWQKFGAHFLHWGIYVIVIAQSLTGLLNLIFAGSEIPFFELIAIPALTEKHDELHSFFSSIHYVISIVIYPLFAIHISSAIYHQLFGVLDD